MPASEEGAELGAQDVSFKLHLGPTKHQLVCYSPLGKAPAWELLEPRYESKAPYWHGCCRGRLRDGLHPTDCVCDPADWRARRVNRPVF